MNNKSINSAINIFNNLLGSQCQNPVFWIPIYQREYTWGSKKNKNKNIENFIKNIKNSEELNIGSFYIKDIKGEDKKWEIVDGQQRLTTIILILLYLRNKLVDEVGIRNEIETLIMYHGYNDKLKIIYENEEVEVNDALDKLIENNGKYIWDKKNANICVINGYVKICNEFEQYNNDELRLFFKNIKTITGYINDIGDDIEGWDFFINLNSTSKPLSPYDLYIGKANSYIKDFFKKNNFYKDKFSIFFRYFIIYLTMKSTIDIKFDTMFDHYNDYLKNHNNFDFHNEFKNFLEFHIKNFNHNNKNYVWVEMNMLLVPIYYLYKGKNKDWEDIFVILQKYYVRRALAQEDTSGITRLIPTLLFSKKANEWTTNDVIKLMKEKKNDERNVSDEEIIHSFISKTQYGSNKLLIKLIMCKYWSIKHNKTFNEQEYDLIIGEEKNYNLEHIEPQSTQYKDLIDDIGNLIILDMKQNSKLGKKDFKIKKETYKKQLLDWEEVFEKDIWTKDEIKNRNNDIMETIIKDLSF